MLTLRGYWKQAEGILLSILLIVLNLGSGWIWKPLFPILPVSESKEKTLCRKQFKCFSQAITHSLVRSSHMASRGRDVGIKVVCQLQEVQFSTCPKRRETRSILINTLMITTALHCWPSLTLFVDCFFELQIHSF